MHISHTQSLYHGFTVKDDRETQGKHPESMPDDYSGSWTSLDSDGQYIACVLVAVLNVMENLQV